MSSMDEVLNHGLLLELAGGRYFERGEGYYREGRVRDLLEHEGAIAAKVVGTEEYRVRFRAEDEELDYSCDCPLGMDGEFCKHCVAVGLAWLAGESTGDIPGGSVTMDDVRKYLEGREKNALVGIILEQAVEDELLRERLLLRAAREVGRAPDLDAFRRAIDNAFDPGDFPESYQAYARGIENTVGSLSELIGESFAAETIELAEYALRAAENAMGYDTEGYMLGVLQDIERLHHEACKQAAPDPEILARRLFEWELNGHYDTFFDAVDTYADVLGERGLARYRKLAEEEWAGVPTLGPGEGDPELHHSRFRITHIMETLAARENDLEALVAVMSRDLSRPHAYLRIAEVYRRAGDHDQALEWAEEGMWVFPDKAYYRLRGFLIEEYHRRGRHEEAMDLVWTEFAERPHLEGYRRLKDHADQDGSWHSWRGKALDFVREDIARRKKESKDSYFPRRVDHSMLVEILLWEGNVEDAWREAKEGGCADKLWLDLARRREHDHPQDALDIYWTRIEPLIEQTNNSAYREAYDLLLRARALMRRLGHEQEFEEYVELLRLEYKRKRNFMKLLDGME